MIVVIADDFSGAAELANVALGAGLSADVQRRFDARSHADVVCVTTETRSLSVAHATMIVDDVARQVLAARPALVYKKCDSLLRGHVAAEARVVASVFGRERIVIAAANPSRGRTVQSGTYFIGATPLAASALASDPEHPRLSSSVAELIGDLAGVETPDVASPDDVLRLARSVTPCTLAVGAADFFSALLSLEPALRRALPAVASRSRAGATLFVCGSLAAWLERGSEPYTHRGIATVPMPRALHDADGSVPALDEWVDQVLAELREKRAICLAVSRYEPKGDASSSLLTDRLAATVALVLARAPVDCICIEGGATATAIAARLGLESFHAERFPGAGVGALRPVGAEGPQLLVKPGSYPWPDAVWEFATA
ncbi:MAG: four-carbon acid sugar kinase family protein [Gemmatimonadota bacterium]